MLTFSLRVHLCKGSAFGTYGSTLQLLLIVSDIDEVALTIVQVELVGQPAKRAPKPCLSQTGRIPQQSFLQTYSSFKARRYFAANHD